MAITNVLLVRTRDGYIEVENAGSVGTWGRREGFLSLGQAATAEATENAASQLGIIGSPQVATSLVIESGNNTGDEPYGGFDLGDMVTVPGAGTQRVVSIGVTCDDEGFPIFVPGFEAVRRDPERGLQRTAKRMVNGTLGGFSETATPARPGATLAGNKAVDPRQPKILDNNRRAGPLYVTGSGNPEDSWNVAWVPHQAQTRKGSFQIIPAEEWTRITWNQVQYSMSREGHNFFPDDMGLTIPLEASPFGTTQYGMGHVDVAIALRNDDFEPVVLALMERSLDTDQLNVLDMSHQDTTHDPSFVFPSTFRLAYDGQLRAGTRLEVWIFQLTGADIILQGSTVTTSDFGMPPGWDGSHNFISNRFSFRLLST